VFHAKGTVGVKQPEREADRPTPTSAEVKNGEAVPTLHHTGSGRGAGMALP
jgi:hypothetical protein